MAEPVYYPRWTDSDIRSISLAGLPVTFQSVCVLIDRKEPIVLIDAPGIDKSLYVTGVIMTSMSASDVLSVTLLKEEEVWKRLKIMANDCLPLPFSLPVKIVENAALMGCLAEDDHYGVYVNIEYFIV